MGRYFINDKYKCTKSLLGSVGESLMKRTTYELKLRKLRTLIAFIVGDEAQGGCNRPEEKKDLQKQIEDLQKEPIED